MARRRYRSAAERLTRRSSRGSKLERSASPTIFVSCRLAGTTSFRLADKQLLISRELGTGKEMASLLARSSFVVFS